VIGPLFLLNGIAAGLIGAGLLLTDAALIVVAGIGYAFTTLLAFVVSATHGLFGWQEVWSGTAQTVAGLTELGALLLLLLLLANRVTGHAETRATPQRPRPFERRARSASPNRKSGVTTR
jgi:hypothetical protein